MLTHLGYDFLAYLNVVKQIVPLFIGFGFIVAHKALSGRLWPENQNTWVSSKNLPLLPKKSLFPLNFSLLPTKIPTSGYFFFPKVPFLKTTKLLIVSYGKLKKSLSITNLRFSS
jgi:hypothetical protein